MGVGAARKDAGGRYGGSDAAVIVCAEKLLELGLEPVFAEVGVVVGARDVEEMLSLDPGAEGKLPDDESVLVDLDSSEPCVVSAGRILHRGCSLVEHDPSGTRSYVWEEVLLGTNGPSPSPIPELSSSSPANPPSLPPTVGSAK